MTEHSANQIGAFKLYMLMVAMLLTGSANTILMKVQDETDAAAPNSGYDEPVPFTQPYVQCAVMFVGETLCLLFYGAKLLYQKYSQGGQGTDAEKAKMLASPGTQQAQQVHLKTNINPLLLAIPAACDTCGSTLMNIALTMTPASIYQMMRGFVVLITAGMAYIFLKRKQFRHHVASLIVLVIGVFLVGLSSIVSEDSESDEDESTGLGILLIIIAQLFTGTQFIVEEKLFSGYYLDPFKVVGLEGCWGVLYWAILLPLFQLINCGGTICPYGKLSYTSMAFEQYGQNHALIWLSVGICLSIAAFNGCGVSVTKYASAAQRSTIDTCRTLVVWIFFMAFPASSPFKEYFSWLQLVGFIILVMGTLAYNEIIEVPFCGFDRNTKRAIKERMKKEGSIYAGAAGDKDLEYTALSPHANYDATRMKRNLMHKQEEAIKSEEENHIHLNYTQETSYEK